MPTIKREWREITKGVINEAQNKLNVACVWGENKGDRENKGDILLFRSVGSKKKNVPFVFRRLMKSIWSARMPNSRLRSALVRGVGSDIAGHLVVVLRRGATASGRGRV
jgi:hypothetical protein